MHITIIGNAQWKYCAEADWRDAFSAKGHSCVILHEAFANEKEIVEAAEQSNLLMWVSSARNYGSQTILKCNELTTTVAWHPDLFWGLSKRGDWQKNPMWAAHYVFTADGGNDDRWAGMGVDHRWLLPGVRAGWTERGGRLREGMACDVAFVGNGGATYHDEWPYRTELLANLKKICAKNGWTFKNPGGTSRKIERNQRMNDFYRSAKVTVGDSLCFDQEYSRYWSDRVYEATGRNGLIIMPQIDVLSAQYEGKLPMYPWGDWGALEEQIGAHLADEDLNASTRFSCHAVTAARHTYLNRVDALLEALR